MLHTKIKSTGVATIFLSGVFLFGFFSQSCQEEDEINKEVIDDHKGTEKQFQDAWNRETGKDVMEYVQPGLWDFFNEDPDPGEVPVGETVERDGEPMDEDECWDMYAVTLREKEIVQQLQKPVMDIMIPI